MGRHPELDAGEFPLSLIFWSLLTLVSQASDIPFDFGDIEPISWDLGDEQTGQLFPW
jgi:hypothetical protein